jgi:hypothetical protein
MNGEALKAINCVLGSNCLVSTTEEFYEGPRGIGVVSEATKEYIKSQIDSLDSYIEDLNSRLYKVEKLVTLNPDTDLDTVV